MIDPRRAKYFNLIIFILLTIIICFVTYLIFRPNYKAQSDYSSNNTEKLNKKEQTFNPDFSDIKNQLKSTDEEVNPSDISEDNLYLVTRVIDGDTFKIINGQSVRLIGLDAPELGQPYSERSKNYLKNLIEGKEVILEKDVSEYDQYNRLLRYVYLPLEDDNYLFVNQEMVLQGLAYAWTYPPDIRYSADILKAQDEAQAENKELWE